LVNDPNLPDRLIFEQFRERAQVMPNLYRVLANTPALLTAWVAFAWPLRESSASPRAIRELAIVYLAIRRSCNYVQVHHGRYAHEFGVTPEQIQGLEHWQNDGTYSEEQRIALQLVDDIVDHGAASAATVAECRRLFRDDGSVELLVTVGFYEAVCVINSSLGVPIEV
jgi:AhpD family alkylhydroperoxidase